LLDGDCRVAKNAAKGTESNLVVKWNGDGEALRVGWVAKPDMAALLAHRDIPELSQSTN
jgi:hypothetical protein